MCASKQAVSQSVLDGGCGGRGGLLPVHFPSLNIYIYIQYSTVFNTVNSEDTDKYHMQINLPSSVDQYRNTGYW